MAVGGSILYVGGDFNIAGQKASFKFGEWTDVPNSIKPKEEGDGSGGAAVSVNPNPVVTKAAVHINLGEHPIEGNVRVAVYDGLGREVALLYEGDASAASGDLEWNASGAAAGVYYLSVRGGSYFRSWPVLVQH
jgi:hypothetical protein